MRRVKSAPENLALMANKKKPINSKPQRSIIAYFNNKDTPNKGINYNKNLQYRNNYRNNYKSKKKSDYNNGFVKYLINKNNFPENDKNYRYNKNNSNQEYKNKFTEKKKLKSSINDATNLLTDITVEYNHYSLEELSIIYTCVIYLNNNIFKRDKFKELYYFIIKALVRYHVLLFVHIYILHDKTDNIAKIVNAVDIDQITNVVHLLPFNS